MYACHKKKHDFNLFSMDLFSNLFTDPKHCMLRNSGVLFRMLFFQVDKISCKDWFPSFEMSLLSLQLGFPLSQSGNYTLSSIDF